MKAGRRCPPGRAERPRGTDEGQVDDPTSSIARRDRRSRREDEDDTGHAALFLSHGFRVRLSVLDGPQDQVLSDRSVSSH